MLWFSNQRRRSDAHEPDLALAPETGDAATPQGVSAAGGGSDADEAGIGNTVIENTSARPSRDASQITEAPAPANPSGNSGIDPVTKSPITPLHPAAGPVGHRHCGGVALALGGGVAKGWAHIGVLRAAEEFGLPISMVAGTSIGALVGGCYLSGNLDELEEFARSITKTNLVRYLDFTLRGSGLIAGSRLARRMEEHMADVRIEDLPKPFVAVATEISSGHEVWLSDGPMVPALRASYALPGVFTPVLHGGRQLVDGALVNPVPVSVCRAYEPDVVIAINLNSETFGRGTVIRPSHDDAIEDAIMHDRNSQAASWFSFMHRSEKATHRQNRLGVTSVMVEAFNIIQDRIARARLAGDPPDFTIRPKLKSVGLIEFHKAGEAIELGYNETMGRLAELKAQGALDRIMRV